MKFHPALAAKLVIAAALLTPEAAQAASQAGSAPAHATHQTTGQHALYAAQAATFTPAPAKFLRLPKARRCLMPKLDLSNEAAKLGLQGYRQLSYQGRKSYASRCAQLLYFSACKGVSRYRVIVRYVRSKRSVVALRQGSCLVRLPGRPRRRVS